MGKLRNRCVVLGTALLLAACSTTRRLPEGEVLYTGVRKIRIEPDSGTTVRPTAAAAAKKILSVAPNNPLYSPYWRTPLPIGLWAYNYLYTPREKGFKYWLYRRLAKQPVLISSVQPELRARVAAQALEEHGYFGSQGACSLLYRKRGRKAKVLYALEVAPPWQYGSIAYPAVGGELRPLIDSLRATSLLRTGAQYDLDTLTLERSRIARTLRNRGCYYFRPDYLEYLADTTQGGRQVALRLDLRDNTPAVALRTYRVGGLTVRLSGLRPAPVDTLQLDGLRVVTPRPMRVRPRVLRRALALRPGQLLTLDGQNRTLNELNKLGIFRSVHLEVEPLDSLRGGDSLGVTVDARFDDPLEAALETDVTSKSNSFLGPGITFRITHRNLFRGGEVLSVKLNGSYEWQTGNRNSGGHDSRLNSYELGLDAALDIPRLWRYPGSLSFQLGADLMNRPDYFRLVAFSGSAGCRFRTSPYSYHAFTPVRLTFNRLLHTTASFDETMDENPAIALSFRDQFVPSLNYVYTFDRSYGATQNRRFYWQSNFTSAGNLLSGLLDLCGVRRPHRLFGNRYSQFVKEICEVKFYHRIGRRDNGLATRFLVGVGYAYGNSEVMPYSEQFYIGGANSIRAFTVRSLGPGSYRPPRDDRNGYLDQTGDFKLEANAEFRFGIVGRLHGAVFVDAGNIWLLKKDPDRPGAELRARGFWNDIALGTGAGLRYDIGYLVLRADLGIGIHTPYPNPDRRGYYNIAPFRDGLGFHLAIGYPF